MLKNVLKRFLSMTMAIVMVISMLPATAVHVHAASGNLTMTDENLTVSYSGEGTVSGGGTSINASVAGADKSGCTAAKAKTATVTFTNELGNGKAAYLSFDYNITANNGSVEIGSDTLTGSGSYSVLIEDSLNKSMVLTSGKGSKLTTAITLTNVALTEVSTTEVTFKAVENGSYTVDNEAITSDTVKEITPPATYALAATPAEGYKFVGWYSEAAQGYASYNETASITVNNEDVIYPVFIPNATPIFSVGGQIYTDLNMANAAAVNGTNKRIILIQSGTLPAGNYEISSDVQLLIPYNDAYTADFDENPGLVNARKEGTYAKPTVFRSLTLENGAVINCYGQINVNSQMYVETNIYTSQVTGPYGAIDLTAGSALNMESGSILYCYGYIGGEGAVVSKNGSKVYQMMQINDWRGGTATSDLSDKMKGNSFLFSQYYLQNVEANLTVYSGGTMYAVTGLTAGSGILNKAKQVSAPIVGTNAGLFRMTTGTGDYINLKYDPKTDRMLLDLYGSISTVAIEMSVNLGIGLNFSLNTDEYILPLPANYTINIHSGSRVAFTEKFKLLPGAEINVHEGAQVTIGQNGAVYIYDVDDWNSGKYTHQKTIYPLRYVHATKGAPVARTSIKNAILNVDGNLVANGPVYSTNYTENGGDAGITGTGAVQINAHGSTHLLEVNNNNTDSLVTITCVPVVANMVGQSEPVSLGLGMWKTIDEQWYQYTMALENARLVSGAYEADGAIYVGNAFGDAEPAVIETTDPEKPCVTAEGATATRIDAALDAAEEQTAAEEQNVTEEQAVAGELVTYTISGFKGNAVVKASAHTSEEVPEKAPTCEADGLTAGSVCSVCGEILTAQEEIEALGHTEESLAAVAPTCTATGLTEGKKCSACGEILIAQEEVAALGHMEEEIPGVAATCTETGLTAGKKCSVCGEVTQKQEVIDAAGHKYDSQVTKPATCTEDGIETFTCHCGDTYTEVISATGHNYSVEITGTSKNPTCTEDGKHVDIKCANCDDVQTGATIPATGHSHTTALPDTDKAPTCTEAGKELDYQCANCEDIKTGAAIAATGHEHSLAVEGSYRAATCTESGKEADLKCVRCDDVKSGAVIPAAGHKEVITPGKAPTCTETGLKDLIVCEICDAVLQSQDEIPVVPHSYREVVTPPTCTDQGYTTYTCKDCGHSYMDDYTSIDANSHDYNSQIVVEPTCTNQGYTADVCAICGHHSKIENTETDVLGHNYLSQVTAPTCTADGYTTYTCDRCQDSYKSDVVNKLGHDYQPNITGATCTTAGYTTNTCSRCGNSYISDHVDALGHDCVPTVVNPTCTEQGYTIHDCSRCDYTHIPSDSYRSAYGHQFEYAVLSATCTEDGYTVAECMDCGLKCIAEATYVPFTGHHYNSEVTSEATCTEPGVITFTCEGCGHTYTEIVEATSHEMAEEGVITSPGCKTEGYTTYACTKCDYSYQTDRVAALGCSYGEWTNTKNPTCTEAGERQRTCARCGETETETVTATGHGYVDTVVPPTCTEKGYTEHLCTCGDKYQDTEVEPLGHTEEILPAKDATCAESGLTEGKKCSVCNEILTPQEEIPTIEHTFGEWNVTKFASCSEPGEETRTCSVCFGQETRSTELAAHIVAIDNGKPATYDATGLTDGSHCSSCNQVITAQQEIPMLVIDWEAFINGLEHLEYYANEYVKSNPGKDPTKLMINYIRTGISRYTDDAWDTMAGAPETPFINEVRAYDTINGSIAHALRAMEYKNITLPNGSVMVFDHMFGAMNVSSKNNYTQVQNDFGSWAGDICDLMQFASEMSVTYQGDMDALVQEVKQYFGRNSGMAEVGGFSYEDVDADLDAFYVINQITRGETSLYKIFSEYYTMEGPTEATRAAYFLNNRFPGKMSQEEIREAIYTTYKNHFLIQVLESSRGLSELNELREAACYVFADYLYEKSKGLLEEPNLPGEGEEEDKPAAVYTVFSSSSSTLAPGIGQTINYATDAQGKQIVYYMANVDITRDDVNIYANYAGHDPSNWAMASVSAQMAAAQAAHSNPEDSENYIENYNVILGTNASFYNMSTGQPSGLLVMHGVTYQDGNTTPRNFFAILKDGTPFIGTGADYAAYKDQIQEAVSGGSILVKDGAVVNTTPGTKAPRTAIGITAEGKLVMIVLDGRQEPFSAGADYLEMGTILVDAGCVIALELDGGGSSTFVAKQEGSDNISLVNRPSDSVERSVSSSLLVVSTAETSQEFHHAVVETATEYMTVGSVQEITLTGVGAAGNKADIPEGAYLRVSDETMATIDGTAVVAKAVGAVNVELVLGDQVVGSKRIRVIRRPNGLRFGEANLNVIYGVPQELPLIATYLNSLVTINPNDIVWEMSNGAAGKMEGFSFVGNEASGVRNVTIVAKVKEDASVTAYMGLRLYGADESIFDFDNVTSGNESLAWNRVVTNAMTPDQKNYYAADPNAQVEAEYTFALDMKAIKAPARLQPLMEYLNGFAEGVGENATPWDYMLALGGRVSDLTNVTIRAVMPEGVEVSYEDLTFVNDFMVLDKIEYNETNRTLTMILGWTRQTAGIDPSTANSQGILSGMKLIFKDPTKMLENVNIAGDVTYDIYLDTSQLHSFAKDPANQAAYGIYDYINPNDPEDAGGHFKDTYITFEDSFNLHRNMLNGWVTKGDSLHYYYVDNEMVTGIYCAKDMDGTDEYFYYDFGEDGISTGIYTGLFYDETAKAYRYARQGVLKDGWIMIGEDWHYFGYSDKNAYTGNRKVGGVYFDFEENGRVAHGVWAKDMGGTKYYYGPSYYLKGWYTIDGMEYCFKNGYLLTGIDSYRIDGSQPYRYYDFGDNGAPAKLLNGIHFIEGKLRYLEDGVLTEKGLFKYGDDYYFSVYKGELKTNGEANTYKLGECDMPNGRYYFGSDGKLLLNDIVERDGKLYYYENGKPTEKGLFEFNGNYYYAVYKGEIKTSGEYNTYKLGECDMPSGKYLFDEEGKMVVNDIVQRDGKLYYYENGKPTEKGLFKFRGDYYFSVYGGLLKSNGIYGTFKIGECDLPDGRYEFGADGKMLQGIVEKDGQLYYYENGKGVEKGLFKFNDDYYFSVSGGLLRTNGIYGTYMIGECDLPNGQYEFGPDGKMAKGIIARDGKLYYYENGKGVEKGLFKFGDDYYFAIYRGELKTNGVYGVYILEDCGLPKGNYEFGSDGKMLQGIVEKDGKLYYYENGKGVEKGLFKIGDDYYFAGYKGELRVNGVYSAYKTDACDLPNGRYEFDIEGKMLQGIVEKNGKLYYYENGVPTEKGLFKYNGDYYFAISKGELKTNGEYNTYKLGECDLPGGRYEFDAEGKMVQGIVEKNGKLYYYENGRGAEKGLFYYNGHYYFSVYKGELVVNKVFNVYNGNGLLIEKRYTFNELGQIVA